MPIALSALYPLERAMLDGLKAAAANHARQVEISADPQRSPQIRGEFLRAFMLECIPDSKIPIGRLTLSGAYIFEQNDRLYLSGIELKYLVCFIDCHFAGGIDVSDSEIIGLELIAGDTSEFFADRLNAKGSLSVRGTMSRDRISRGRPFVVSHRIRLCGAFIHGNLDLRGCWLTGQGDPEAVPLSADGLTVEGNVLLGSGFEARGEIRLNGCQISRNLDCSGATFRCQQRYSLSAAGATVKGSLYFTKDEVGDLRAFSSVGVIRLEGAKIEGDLDFSGGRLIAKPVGSEELAKQAEEDDWYVIMGDGLIVGGDLLFADHCEIQGSVRLISARVGGDFYCENAVFDFAGEETFVADGIDVSGTTFFIGATRTNGLFRFVQSKFRQGFRARGLRFDLIDQYHPRFDNSALVTTMYGLDELTDYKQGGISGIYAPKSEVTGTFVWREIEKNSLDDKRARDLWLYVRGSNVDFVETDNKSWNILDRFELAGCNYGSITLTPDDFVQRLADLNREYAILNRGTLIGSWILAFEIMAGSATNLDKAVRRFKPQPYLQLAKVARQVGYEAAATHILVQLERNRTRYSNLSWVRQLGRHLLDAILRYGHSKFRPIWILLVWAIFSAFWFEAAYRQGVIVPNSQDPPRATFNAVIYAIDSLVPIVDLNQKKNWIVEPLSGYSRVAHIGAPIWCENAGALCQFPYRGVGLLVLFNTFFGWMMTTFFVAGISGLLRTGSEEG